MAAQPGYGGYGSIDPVNLPTPWLSTGSSNQGGSSSGFFDDPTSQPIEGAWNTRMQQLQAPAPGYGDIQGILGGFLKPDPRFNDALNNLFNMSKGGAPTAKVLSNPYMAQYADATKTRMAQLNQDPFSSSDEAALKARFFDSLALQRDDAYKQNAQEMASRGLAPSSGVAQALGAETSAGYQKARAAQQQSMLQYVMDESNRRKDLAVQMSAGLEGAGAQETSMQQQAGLGNAQLQNQWKVAQSGMLGNIAQALLSQQNAGLNAATTMASLRRQQYLDDQSRGDALLQTSALPNALANQRMQMLMQTLSGGPNSQSLFGDYATMQQLQNQQDAARASGNAALYGGILGAAGTVGGAYINKYGFGKPGGTTGNPGSGYGLGGFSGGGYGSGDPFGGGGSGGGGSTIEW